MRRLGLGQASVDPTRKVECTSDEEALSKVSFDVQTSRMAPSTVTLASMSHDRLACRYPTLPSATRFVAPAAAVPASRTTPNRAQSPHAAASRSASRASSAKRSASVAVMSPV